MATRSSILAWYTLIPWTEELAGYSPWGHKRGQHDLTTKQSCSHPLVSGFMPFFFFFFPTGDISSSIGRWFRKSIVSCRIHCILIGCSTPPPADNFVPLLGQQLLGDVICKRPQGSLVGCSPSHLLAVKCGCWCLFCRQQCCEDCENVNQALWSL